MTDFDNIIKLLETYNNVILLGAGGVGKSYNINKIVEYYEAQDKIVAKTAPTGVASFNIGGVTINSFLKFADTNSMEEYEVWVEYMEREFFATFDITNIHNVLTNEISNLDLLIIDEVSMISAEKWELIDSLLTKFKFRGKIIISGDVFQLPSIGTKSKYLEDKKNDDRFFFESPIWKEYKFVPYVMEKIYRTDDLEFMEVLKNIRMGELPQETFEYINNMRENEYVLKNNPTILASQNEFVFNYNKDKLDALNERLCVIEHNIKYKAEEYKTMYNDDIDKYISKQLMIEKKLFLKKDALIIFVTNSPDGLFYNGEKGIIRNITEDNLYVEKLNGTFVTVEKSSYPYYEYISGKFTLIANIFQFPVKLGWAMTIHKSQSLSIDNIVLDIKNIFTNGQFYVGLSRAINPRNVYIRYDKSKYLFEYDLKRFIKVLPKVKLFYDKAKRISNVYKEKHELTQITQ